MDGYIIYSIFCVIHSLQQILLQPEEELLEKRYSELVSEGAAPKPKKTIGRVKVQGGVMFFC